MTIQFQRRSVEKTVQVLAYVRPEVKDRVRRLADASSVPQWAIVEAAVMALDEHTPLVRTENDEVEHLHVMVSAEAKARLASLAKAARVPQRVVVETAIMADAAQGDVVPEGWSILGPNGEAWQLPRYLKTA